MESTRDTGIGGLVLTERKGEMAIAAAAAQAKAKVEAQYVIAYNRPRKIMEARSAILDACKREKFAGVARYKKPVGKKQVNGRWEQQFIEGFSIRFAEVAIQAMKNITVETSIVWEDAEQRTVHVSVTDLESNLSYGEDITISKTVERRSLKENQEKLGERLNSYGEKVFIVAATDDEVANKVAAQRSKVIRNSGLRLIPQDFLEEAYDAIMLTLEKGGTDPKAEVKKVVDAFHGIGVGAGELEKYLSHSLDTISKKELIDLRTVYSTIKDGESSWADYVGDGPAVPRAEATPGPAKAPFKRATQPVGDVPEDVRKKAEAEGAAGRQATASNDGDLGPVTQPDNVIPIEAKVEPNPTSATAATSVAPVAQPSQSPSSPTESSAPSASADSPKKEKVEFVLPPSKMPEGWLPFINPQDAEKVWASFYEWLSTEEVRPEEFLAVGIANKWASKDQKLADLSISKIISALKSREVLRKRILEARG